MNLKARYAAVLLLLQVAAGLVRAQPADGMSGLQIMEEVQRRHYFDSNVYEEQSIILIDDMGNRDTRALRRYSKTDASGNVKYLLLFDSPAEVNGVALLATRDAHGGVDARLYLPAHGGDVLNSRFSGSEDNVLGMDFSFDELMGEFLQDYQFVRREQRKIENIQYYLVDVYRKDADIAVSNPIRRHYVRADNYYITRTDYLDRYGRLIKQQTLHDLLPLARDSWRAGMILMEDLRENHSTLVKVNRRIFSEEYVPDEVFTINWLYQNQPPLDLEPPAGNEELEGGMIGMSSGPVPVRPVTAGKVSGP
jgi:hypothetical protein